MCAFTLTLGLLVWPACKRGTRPATPPAPAPLEHAVSAGAPRDASATASGRELRASHDGWERGELPASVLEGTPRAGGTLVVGVDVEPGGLNTLIASDWLAKRIVLGRIQQGLVRVDAADDPNYRILPALAERWEITDAGRTYTFQLRRDVRWHDGKPFSARDVIATLDKLRDPLTLAASARADFAELESYRAPDELSVVLRWKQPYFLALDALADLAIQPAHIIEALSPRQYNEAATNPLQRAPIGTGPFKFVRWDGHSQILLERNPQYWGKPPFLDGLIFRFVPEGSVRLRLAQRGELDLLYRLKADDWIHMQDPTLRRHWHRSRSYPAKYHWIGWNLEHPLFADVRVRRALTLLVDRPGIIEKLLYGLPRPTSCHFYWASAACDPALSPLPYAPTEAAQLLDSADVRDHDGDGLRDRAGRAFRFTLSLPSGAAEALRVAGKIQQDLRRAGIDMQVETLEWSAFMQRVRVHAFDAVSLSWSGDARMDPTRIWHSSSIAGGSNFISYRNAEVDGLIERARVTLDAAERDALFRRLGAILHADQPYTILFVPAELDLLHERVRGARPSLYFWQFEELWLAGGGADRP